MRVPNTFRLLTLFICALAFGDVWAAAPAPLNERAPALVLRDVEGRMHDLSDYRGKVVLINFWATWCEPCRMEMPSMQRLSEKLTGKRFALLAVNLDEPEARVRAFLKQIHFDEPVLLDVNKSIAKRWGARVLPTTFVVGPDGRVRYRLVGEMDWSSDSALAIVSELLAGT
jgi:thiol-disulfide isomerase/thioredoxin